MKLTLLNQSGRAAPRDFLNKWIRALDGSAAHFIEPELYRGRELVVVYLSSKDARALNRQWRSKDYATDVLSFASDDPRSLGELVICPDVISRQAREHGLRVREELGYMVLHGFLHLLGYEHEGSQRRARQMFAIQDALFELLLARFSKSKPTSLSRTSAIFRPQDLRSKRARPKSSRSGALRSKRAKTMGSRV